MILASEWKKVINIGKRVRSQKLNGLDEWQKLKKIYNNYRIDKDIIIKKSFFEFIGTLDYKQVHSDTDENEHLENAEIKIGSITVEYKSSDIDHFFIQHFRIPMTTAQPMKLTKLMQIAYNIGQMSAEFQNYDVSIQAFYKKNKLNSILSYVNEDIIESELILINQHGSGNLNIIKLKSIYKSNKYTYQKINKLN